MAESSDSVGVGVRVSPAEARAPAEGWELNWLSSLYRTEAGMPMLPADFVASQGQGVRLIDVREPQEFVGSMGYIPGSDWVPPEGLETLADRLGPDCPVIVLSSYGERAGRIAYDLERRGVRYAAALGGGISQWISVGYGTTRDPAILDRCDVLQPVERPRPAAADGGVSGAGLTAEDVRSHVGNPHALRWLRLPAVLLHARVSCVDGRDDRGVIGAPGGNAGVIVLALAALERVLGRPIDPETVFELLDRRGNDLGGLYLHTDQQALDGVAASIRADPRLAAGVNDLDGPIAWRQFLKRPPILLREAVLEHLCEAPAIGCGHLRFLARQAEEYRVRPGLVQDFLRAFFRLRWEEAFKVEYETLHGRHDERAVLVVKLRGGLKPYSRVPLVSPTCFGSQVFVSHPQVTRYLLEVLVDFFLEQDDLVPGLTAALRPALAAECDALNALHTERTVGQLARGLPVYEVTFGRDGQYEVAHLGGVP